MRALLVLASVLFLSGCMEPYEKMVTTDVDEARRFQRECLDAGYEAKLIFRDGSHITLYCYRGD